MRTSSLKILQSVLNRELLSAMGCTEPGAIAYACALAKEQSSGSKIKAAVIEIDKNIFKNGMSVGIPGAENYTGNLIAGALGLVAGNPEYKLQALKNISRDDFEKAVELIQQKKIKIVLKPNVTGIFVRVYVKTENDDEIEVIIEKFHSNVTCIKLNGNILSESHISEEQSDEDDSCISGFFYNANLDIFIELIDNISETEIEIIRESIKLNMGIAEYGLKKYSSFHENFLMKQCSDINSNFCRIMLEAAENVFAAVYARMNGDNVPVMSSGGSGNAGITVTIPIVIFARSNKNSETELYKALLLGFLVNSWVRHFTGKIGMLCGGTISAGAGATAGISFLMDPDKNMIENSIINVLNSNVGIICDGAKTSCAFKISSAVYSFFQSAYLSHNQMSVKKGEGIIGKKLVETLNNLKYISEKTNSALEDVVMGIINTQN